MLEPDKIALLVLFFVLGSLAGHIDFLYNKMLSKHKFTIENLETALLSVCYTIDKEDYGGLAARYLFASEAENSKKDTPE